MGKRGIAQHVIGQIQQGVKIIDLRSLQTRLTVGLAIVSTVGLGSVAGWMGWKMHEILVTSHKQSVSYVAERFPLDLRYYGGELPTQQAIQKTVATLSSQDVLLWVKSEQGTIIAQSPVLNNLSAMGMTDLITTPLPSGSPQPYNVDGRMLIACSNPLTNLQGDRLGTLFVAHDITEDQKMVVMVVQELMAASLLAMVSILVAIAWYVRRSLRSLWQISQLAESISASDLGKARVHLSNAPSEVQRLARTCNMMLDRLSEAWGQQRQLVGDLSHELRTPLSIVHGYLQSVMRRSSNLTDSQQEALAIAASESERTISLLQDMLDLARAGSGYLHLHWEEVCLNDLLTEVGAMTRQFNSHQIEVVTPHEQMVARADRNRLKQVLLNLLDNAVKYSEPQQPVALVLSRQDGMALIEVRDRGHGIALQDQAKIFEPFYRVDEARTRSGGSGLGLSIVKSLVEAMGSQISVRSKVGEGSIFTIALPMQMAQP